MTQRIRRTLRTGCILTGVIGLLAAGCAERRELPPADTNTDCEGYSGGYTERC